MPTSEYNAIPDDTIYVRTFSGRHFHLYGDDPEEILLDDIAHHLSIVPRFTGATTRPYSVNEHQLLVMQITDAMPELFGDPDITLHRYHALIHDTPEYVLNDVSSPVKSRLPEYQILEGLVWKRIAAKLGVPVVRHDAIKRADWIAYFVEATSLQPHAKLHERVETAYYKEYWPLAEKWLAEFGPVPQDMPHPMLVKDTWLNVHDQLVEDLTNEAARNTSNALVDSVRLAN